MDIRVQAHVAYRLSYHIVWIPKYRWKILKPGVASYLQKVIQSYLADELPDVQMEAFSAQVDQCASAHHHSAQVRYQCDCAKAQSHKLSQTTSEFRLPSSPPGGVKRRLLSQLSRYRRAYYVEKSLQNGIAKHPLLGFHLQQLFSGRSGRKHIVELVHSLRQFSRSLCAHGNSFSL